MEKAREKDKEKARKARAKAEANAERIADQSHIFSTAFHQTSHQVNEFASHTIEAIARLPSLANLATRVSTYAQDASSPTLC